MNEQLKSIVERIEALNATKADILADVKEVYEEARSAGFDKKAIREIVKLRKLDPDELDQLDEITKLHRQQIGL
jgi:uncharacterized protein (UPF0335 family)